MIIVFMKNKRKKVNIIKKYILSFLALGVIMVGTITTNTNTAKDHCKNIINQCYNDISGFGISKEDENNIRSHGAAPTYGEMTFEGTEKLTNYLKPKETDVFVDAGSGVGKVVVQFFFSTPIKKSIGIELSKERFNNAMKVYDILQKNKDIPKDRAIEFYNQDILDADLKDVTLFFMCSTCFSCELMQKITEKLAQLKPGLRVITLKHLPVHKNFKLVHEMTLPMTWSENSTVYIYELLPTKEITQKCIVDELLQ
jgi:hypothetical protein